MKKLKLKALEFGATEMLTRKQLKDVLGGDISRSTGSAFVKCCDPSDPLDPFNYTNCTQCFPMGLVQCTGQLQTIFC